MLFFPLHVTSFCLWDAMQMNDWYDAQQVIIVSASSKTSIGLAYGLDMDAEAPPCIAVTSERNREFVESSGCMQRQPPMTILQAIDPSVPSVIVDMSGNDATLNALGELLGDNMRQCIRVGVTHRDAASGDASLPRSTWFFAPSHVEQRLKDWGPEGFMQKSTEFIQATSLRSGDWLKIRTIDGLDGLNAIFSDVANGNIAADEGLIVKL